MQEIGNLIDSCQIVIKDLQKNINSTYKSNTADISNETTKTIEKLDELKNDAESRYKSYYNRKQIIDYLIYANLVITPILFIIIMYIFFIKK